MIYINDDGNANDDDEVDGIKCKLPPPPAWGFPGSKLRGIRESSTVPQLAPHTQNVLHCTAPHCTFYIVLNQREYCN